MSFVTALYSFPSLQHANKTNHLGEAWWTGLWDNQARMWGYCRGAERKGYELVLPGGQ